MRKYAYLILTVFFIPFVATNVAAQSFIDSLHHYYDLYYQDYSKGDYPNALLYIQKSVLLSGKTADTDELSVKVFERKLNLCIEMSKLDSIESARRELLARMAIQDTIRVELKISLLNTVASSFEVFQNHQQSFFYYQKALTLIDDFPEAVSDKFKSFIYTNISDAYLEKGRYAEAILLLKKAIVIDKALYENAKLDSVKVREDSGDPYINLAIDYFNMGLINQHIEAETSLDYLLLAKHIFKVRNDPIYEPEYLLLHNAIADTYGLLGFYEAAILETDTVLSRLATSARPELILKAQTYEKRGGIYLQSKNFQKAIFNLSKAHQLFSQQLRPASYDCQRTLHQLANAFNENGDYKNSLNWLKRILTISPQPEVIRQEDIDRMVLPELLFKVYLTQARALRKKSTDLNKTQFLAEAQQSYRNALAIFDFLKIDVGEKKSREIFLKNNYSIFAEALNLNYNLWLASGDSLALEEIFMISEKSKNNLLDDRFTQTVAAEVGGVPVDQLATLEQLDREIINHEKWLYEKEIDQSDDDTRLNELLNNLLLLKRERRQLMTKVETDYPRYEALKYQVAIPTISDLQQRLSDQQCVLSYFVGQSFIYVMVVDRWEFSVFRTAKDFPLEQMVADLNQSITDFNSNVILRRRKAAKSYTQKAYRLYEKIFKPYVPKIARQVIILPGNVLGNLGFESLISQMPAPNTGFRDYDYLLHQYTISYQYAAGAIHRTKNRKNRPENNLLAFAPYFAPDESFSTSGLRDFSSLLFNGEEVENIRKIIGGKVFKNHEATEQNFVKEANQYRILHLATHGQVNPENTEYSYLAFSEIEDTIENELLYIKDIYKLKLNADLVVLSACETGTGTVAKGEGIMSLSRGFSYAGADAVVPTLWKISDSATGKLMEYFYRNLKAKLPKDDALTRAKRTYIQGSSHEYAHPFYWAAFVLNGDNTPVDLTDLSSQPIFQISQLSGKHWGFSSIGILMIWGVLWFFRRNNPMGRNN